MNIEEILKNWKICGVESEDKFSLINHYTILFDDKDKGFDYLLEHLEIDKDKLLNTTNPKIHHQIMEIDNGMKDVSFLIENFITNYLWKDVDVEDVQGGSARADETVFTEVTSAANTANTAAGTAGP